MYLPPADSQDRPDGFLLYTLPLEVLKRCTEEVLHASTLIVAIARRRSSGVFRSILLLSAGVHIDGPRRMSRIVLGLLHNYNTFVYSRFFNFNILHSFNNKPRVSLYATPLTNSGCISFPATANAIQPEGCDYPLWYRILVGSKRSRS